jgi:hypothetical protein
VLIALLGLLILATTSGCSDSGPELRFDTSVPPDLEQLVATTWIRFLDAHPGRLGCIGDVTVQAAWELETRAEYRPGDATVVVRVPGTAATLSDAIVHEFAHHIEFTCQDHVELRAAFLEAQGMPESADWFEGDAWDAIPSEQYAEATVEVVLGSRSLRGQTQLSDGAVDVVRSWAADN